MSRDKAVKLLLLGYRATGKSSTGRKLAGLHGLQFIDTDLLIERQAGNSVAEIVAEQGWQGFRAMEKQILGQVIRKHGNAVVACGGGAVLHEDLFEDLPRDVHAVWLQASPDIIVSRIQQDSRSDSLRPSLTAETSLSKEVRKILAEREHLYRKFSEFVIDTGSLKLSEAVEELSRIWKRITNEPQAGHNLPEDSSHESSCI